MTFLRNQIKRRKLILAAVGLLVISLFITAGVLVFRDKQKTGTETGESSFVKTETTLEDVREQKEVRADNLTEAEVVPVEGNQVKDDWRIHGFPYIKLTNQLQVGDYVDVRISFPDGGDFVLLSKKQIKSLSPLREEGVAALWMIVTEEELLRLSSAVVDAYLNEGCCIYAIQYVAETQKEAIVNYVVNNTVKQLMAEDPNIVKKAENVQGYSLWKEYEAGLQREDVYPKQDEIIYMD